MNVTAAPSVWTDFTLSHAGQIVHVRVSPCCWMYRGYGLQFGLSMLPAAPNIATVFVKRKAFECHAVASELIRAEAVRVADEWLNENGTDQLTAAATEWAALQATFAVEDARHREREQKRAAKKRAEMKAKGYGFRFLGVIHPEHGDDRIVEAYLVNEPTAREIATFLKRSVVKNDYRVDAL